MEKVNKTINNITEKIFNMLDDLPGLTSLLITFVIVFTVFR